MKNANSKFLLELLACLDDSFRADNYRRKKTTYRKQNEHYELLVNWQISNDDLPGKIKFTINVGVHDLRLAKILEEEGGPDIWDCHLRQRVGFLMPERQDKWWIVDATLPVSDVLVEELKLVSQTYVLPFLPGFSARDDLLELWRSGIAPGQTDRQRLYFISLLEK